MAFGFEEELKAEIARLRDALDEQTGRAEWNYECVTKCEERVIQRDAEIARLRLTDEECAEINGLISDFSEIADFNTERCHPVYANKARRRAAILRGLLERLK